jgi:hypothetical protein
MTRPVPGDARIPTATLSDQITAATAVLTSGTAGESTHTLRAEMAAAEDLASTARQLLDTLRQWSEALVESYIDAPFGTQALSAAVAGLIDTTNDPVALVDALTTMRAALDEADALGEAGEAIEAEGDVAALRPAQPTAPQETHMPTDQPTPGPDPALVTAYDQLARLDVLTTDQDRRLADLATQLRAAGVDIPGYLDAATTRAMRGQRRLTLRTWLRHRPAPGPDPEPAPTKPGQHPTAAPPPAVVSDDQVAGQIEDVYRQLADVPGAWVSITALRTALPEVAPGRITQVLQALERQDGVHLAPETAQFDLTSADRAAAVRIGGKDNHLIKIDPVDAWWQRR